MFFSSSATADKIDVAGDGSQGTAYVELEIDGDGTVTHLFSDLPYGKTFNSVTGVTGPVTAKLQWLNTTGTVDADNNDMIFVATARVRFENGGFNCNTSTFTMHLQIDDNGSGACPSGGYDYGTGEYCMWSTSSITIPQLAATACNNNGNALNSYFGLGVSGSCSARRHLRHHTSSELRSRRQHAVESRERVARAAARARKVARCTPPAS